MSKIDGDNDWMLGLFFFSSQRGSLPVWSALHLLKKCTCTSHCACLNYKDRTSNIKWNFRTPIDAESNSKWDLFLYVCVLSFTQRDFFFVPVSHSTPELFPPYKLVAFTSVNLFLKLQFPFLVSHLPMCLIFNREMRSPLDRLQTLVLFKMHESPWSSYKRKNRI